MNQNRECKVAEKEDLVLLNSTNKQIQTQLIQENDSMNRIFCMPSVPRPGITSWSLVL
jgi:hypothetical protein